MKKSKKKYTGFTLVELVIVIAIVIILSVVSVPIYRGYTKQAKWAEGYALLGTILSSQKAYYSQYGNFFGNTQFGPENRLFGIDASGNKYFTCFFVGAGDGTNGSLEYCFHAAAKIPTEIVMGGSSTLFLRYSITKGASYADNMNGSWS